MKILSLLFIFILSNFSSYSQENITGSASVSSSLIIGTWVLKKEVRLVKHADNPVQPGMMVSSYEELNSGNYDTSISQKPLTQQMHGANKNSVVIPTDSMIQEAMKIKREMEADFNQEFQKSLILKDSVMYGSNMTLDSMITFVINENKTFSIGSKFNIHSGEWQFNNSMIFLYENNNTTVNKILYLDENNLELEKIAERNVYRMYYEKEKKH